MKHLLLVMVALMSVAILFSLSITPDSPGYDAYKKSLVIHSSTAANPAPAVLDAKVPPVAELLIPLDGTFTLAMGPNDDGSSDEIDLGFTFSLYGQPYTSCYINNNGNITFEDAESSFDPWPFPIAGYPMLAAFFADVDTRGAGQVYYKIEANRMIVIWNGVGYYNSQSDKTNTFEIIMTDGTDPLIGLGNNVCFSYADMQWTTGDASDGIGGFGGDPATVGINKGDEIAYIQSGRFDQPGDLYDGGDGANDGVDWLDDRDLYLQASGAATLLVTPSNPNIVTDGIGMPGGLLVDDPTVSAFYATYSEAEDMTVTIPVGEGLWYGYIYYGAPGSWHQADVFPVHGPGNVVFSNVPFTGGKESIPIILDFEVDDTLPVTLSSFTATLTAMNYVNLTWVSESETNLLGYKVYRNDTLDLSSASLITPTMIGATNTSSSATYSTIDDEVIIGNTYYYWLESIDMGSTTFHDPISVTLEGEIPPVIPTSTSMSNAYPHPFKVSEGTNIDVNIKAGETGTVTIYNVVGQTVQTYSLNEGSHKLNWNGRDSNNRICANGIYFYKLSTATMNQTKKMVIVK